MLPKREFRVGILEEGVNVCKDEVKDTFSKAVNLLHKSKFLFITDVSFPNHAIAGTVSNIFRNIASYACMVDYQGCSIGCNGKFILLKLSKQDTCLSICKIYPYICHDALLLPIKFVLERLMYSQSIDLYYISKSMDGDNKEYCP